MSNDDHLGFVDEVQPCCCEHQYLRWFQLGDDVLAHLKSNQ